MGQPAVFSGQSIIAQSCYPLYLVKPRHSATQQPRQAGQGQHHPGGLNVRISSWTACSAVHGHCDAASSAALLAKDLCMRHPELSCWAALAPAHLEQTVTCMYWCTSTQHAPLVNSSQHTKQICHASGAVVSHTPSAGRWIVLQNNNSSSRRHH